MSLPVLEHKAFRTDDLIVLVSFYLNNEKNSIVRSPSWGFNRSYGNELILTPAPAPPPELEIGKCRE